MKKFLHRWVGLALAAVIGAGCIAAANGPKLAVQAAAADQGYLLGDIDLDGKVALQDAKLLQRALVQKTELTEAQKLAADADQDGVLTSKDAVVLQRTAAGKVKLVKTTVKLDKNAANLKTGSSVALHTALSKVPAGGQKTSWTSSRPEVARVDENGNVTALQSGKTVITARIFNGNTAECVVSVYADDASRTYSGIDVSVHNGDIDWAQAKSAGVDFAMIRCGYGSANWAGQTDKRFHENMKEALAAGVEAGVYHYSYAENTAEAAKEAEFALSLVKGYDFTYPIAIDLEEMFLWDMSRKEVTDMAVAFCEKIKKAGYRPMIYTTRSLLQARIDLSRVQGYEIWLADLQNPAQYDGDYHIWQHSHTGRVNGLSGDVDLNISYRNYGKK